ncbi:MAG: hypothetical protein HY301_19400 [Verrucomicrobia bacterium]|nr:hypothetical protein [Verrucomicrobiota bacterium]
MKRNRQRRAGREALDLIEEAVHLLRLAPAGTTLLYFIGALPFVLGALYFWADMSRGAFADARCFEASLGLALLFVWMKTWQAVFAVELRAFHTGKPAGRWTPRRVLRLALVQAALQPAGLLLLPVAFVIQIPFGWAFAFFQNVVVVGDRADGSVRHVARHAWTLAKLWPGQNHQLILALSGFGFFVFLNLLIALLQVPALLKMLLGLESAFTLSPGALLNTTLLAAVAACVWLALDPLLKAIFVLRCFRGESLTTGEDLRVELKSLTAPRAVALVAALLLLLPSLPAQAAEAAAPAAGVPTAVVPADLDRALDEVLDRAEYNWRLPRERTPEDAQSADNWATRFMDRLATMAKKFLRWGRDLIRSAMDWLEKMFRGRNRSPDDAGHTPFDWAGAVQTLVFVLLAAVVSVLAIALMRAWKRRRPGLAFAAEAVAAVPDLRDENVGADQLPEDGWLRLARELMGRGELRLALRALYLAGLAHLAQRELVKLEKFKSNRDYERELRRRARARPELQSAFAENGAEFDRAWYGLHEVTRDALARFESNLDRIKAA